MNKTIRVSASLVLAVVFVFVFTSISSAQEAEVQKKSSKGLGRSLINYPANFINETVKVVTQAAKGTAGLLADTAKATGETFLAGNTESAPDIIQIPIEGSAQTLKDAVIGTVKIPIEAGKKTAEQNK